MAQEYQGIKSAFEVFTSELTTKKKKIPARHGIIKKGFTQSAVDQTNAIKKKKRNNRLADGIEVINVVTKKRKRTFGMNDKSVIQQLDDEEGSKDEIQTVNITKKKRNKIVQENKNFDKNSDEESVVEVPINGIEFGNKLKTLPSEPKKQRNVDAETVNGDVAIMQTPVLKKRRKGIEQNSITDVTSPTLKKKKSKRALANSSVKKKKQGGKVLKHLEVRDADPAESPGTAGDKCSDSLKEGEQLFAWLIDPINPEEFFRDTWEQRPFMIKRQQPDFYQTLMSTATIHKMLERDSVQFSKNLDVTSYRDGKRETHNPDGRAFPAVVWNHYSAGCSVRLLNPQTFIPKLHLLNTTLQEYFGCFVGANAYLTPPKSQGFAPHYDDIEAFILQLEGQKEWKLYAPRMEQEYLPRFSSENLTEEDIGKPIMEVVLNPGDLLYFPRGTIHQGRTTVNHSLHVTLSCYQRNTWGDLLEKAIPAALKYALEEDVEFRRGLPRDYLRYMGCVYSDQEMPARQAFTERLHNLVNKLFEYLPTDAVVDQLGKQFMHDALPPVLVTDEKRCTVFGDGLKMLENGKLSNRVELELNTRIKLLRAHILRLVVEDEDVVRLYHCVDNSLEYHGIEQQFVELPVEEAPAVELLIRSYPDFVPVSSLPLDTESAKVKFASELWERGLLLTDGPLNVVFDEDS